MRIEPISSAVGAVVTDIDVRKLDDEEFAAVHAAFLDHGALFFRDQTLSEAEHIGFARRWGSIDVNRFFAPVPGHPEIAQVLKEADQATNIGGGWHTDHSYDLVPAMGSILYAREIPLVGGDTLFAGMAAAYDALDSAMQTRIDGLHARHANAHIFGVESEYRKAFEGRYVNPEAAGQEAVHPVVLTHPDSGKRGLYINPGFTREIVGLPPKESSDLLNQLYAHIMQPQFHCRWQWRVGDLAMWDNRATWHYALNDYQGHRRLLHRITIAGSALH
jgi:taurine dioxygenase